MFDLLTYAAPFFVLLLIAEWVTFRHTGDHDHGHDSDHGAGRGDELLGYDRKDTATSLTMGTGNMIVNVGWKVAVAAIYTGVYELTPLRIPSGAWWAWPLLFVADDFAYYWYHRLSHTVRVLWGSHVVHHSSEHYNLSTALRQPWVPMTAFAFWIPLALIGIPPWMILLQQAISLTYQFFIHTEKVVKLPRPIEFVMNTPSHHRAHHGANQIYLDKNYGGITIIWDRLFGTFQPETERVRYGLTKNINSHNPITVATHEYAAILNDIRAADNWRDRAGYILRGPGWAHDRRTATSARAAAVPSRADTREPALAQAA
jgi:sterol desaturase/sphingolipid hydroxylase (fatty acid hydroxylase superfamily)